MLKKLHLVFSVFIIFFFNISFCKADLLSPNSSISPTQVVKIQLEGLMNNDNLFKDSGIEQTWNFAHDLNNSIHNRISENTHTDLKIIEPLYDQKTTQIKEILVPCLISK